MTETNPPPDTGMERAVEAALYTICEAGYLTSIPWMLLRPIIAEALTAADRARGRSYITWRRPEEWTSGLMSDGFVLIIMRNGTPGSWWVSGGIRGGIPSDWRARAKMPAVDAWSETAPHEPKAGDVGKRGPISEYILASGRANYVTERPDTLARTATDGEDSNHLGTTHETPGADVLAGGATDEWIGVKRLLGGTFHDFDEWLATRPDLTHAGTAVQLDEYNIWVTNRKSTQPHTLEDRITALEARPEWTEDKDHALAYALGNLEATQRLAGHTVRADQTRQVRNAAFPEPKL